MGDAKQFFDAQTFAVVGASRDETKVGNTIFTNLLISGKKVFPVNPNAKEILRQKCYSDILEIPYDIDCVVICVPAKLVGTVMRDAQKKKVKCAIIITAGFSENGNSTLEKRVLEIAEEANISILGPNSYGIISPHNKINSTYFSKMPKMGNIAFISQSGAIGSAILDKDIKLSGFVSVGNCSQLDFSDFIEYYSRDEKTKVIAIYLESLKEGRGKRFMEVCSKCRKPIVVLKSGKSKKGQEAAKSHTAALSSEKGVYSGIFKQVGIVEVDSIEQLVYVSKILSKYQNLKNNAIIITNAGGVGVLTTDSCEENEIKIHHISKSSIEELDKVLDANWSRKNPIDLIGDAKAEDYEKALNILEKENAGFYLVLLTPQKMSEPLGTAKVLMKSEKPIFACFIGGERLKESKEFMDKFGILRFLDPKEMCDALGKVLNKD
jgi:acyl-CoA synthetase (NDP forming)